MTCGVGGADAKRWRQGGVMTKGKVFAHRRAFCSSSPSLPQAFRASHCSPWCKFEFSSLVFKALCGLHRRCYKLCLRFNGWPQLTTPVLSPLRPSRLPWLQLPQTAGWAGGEGSRDTPTVSSLLGFTHAVPSFWNAHPPVYGNPTLPSSFKGSAQKALSP